MTVLAYDSEDGFYPILYSDATLTLSGSSGELYSGSVSPGTDGKYRYNNPVLNGVVNMFWYCDFPGDDQFTFPYNPDVYDYYLLGTVVAECNNSNLNDSTFKPSDILVRYYDVSAVSGGWHNNSNTNIYNIDSDYDKGFGFSTKLNFSSADNIGINYIRMSSDKDGSGSKPANLVVEFGILSVEKNTSEEAALAQILSQLQSMESSINSSIGNAAGQITDSVTDAADQIADTIEDQYTMSDSEDFGVGQIADQVEEKLGVLTFGADTLRNFLDLFSAENVGDTELTFPAFQIEVQGVSYNVWQDVTFDLSFLEEHFGVLITAVRTVTVLCVWLAVLGYLVKAKDHFINNRG